MSQRKQQLNQLLDIAKQNEAQAAKQLAANQSTYQVYKEQLDNLLMYQQSYRGRLSEKPNESINITQLQRHYAFMQSLDLAIKQQHQVISDVKQELAVVRENWTKKNHKTQALEHLIEKMKVQEKAIQNKIEQSVNDELSIRRFSNPD